MVVLIDVAKRVYLFTYIASLIVIAFLSTAWNTSVAAPSELPEWLQEQYPNWSSTEIERLSEGIYAVLDENAASLSQASRDLILDETRVWILRSFPPDQRVMPIQFELSTEIYKSAIANFVHRTPLTEVEQSVLDAQFDELHQTALELYKNSSVGSDEGVAETFRAVWDSIEYRRQSPLEVSFKNPFTDEEFETILEGMRMEQEIFESEVSGRNRPSAGQGREFVTRIFEVLFEASSLHEPPLSEKTRLLVKIKVDQLARAEEKEYQSELDGIRERQRRHVGALLSTTEGEGSPNQIGVLADETAQPNVVNRENAHVSDIKVSSVTAGNETVEAVEFSPAMLLVGVFLLILLTGAIVIVWRAYVR